MAESGSEGEFRVTDRRRRVDAEVAPAEAAGVRPPTALRWHLPGRGRDVHPVSRGHAVPRWSRHPARAPAARAAPGEPGRPGVASALWRACSSCCQLCLMALGQAADPATGGGAAIPRGRRVHRSPRAPPGEDRGHTGPPARRRLLDGLIYDLQLRYVAATKPGL